MHVASLHGIGVRLWNVAKASVAWATDITQAAVYASITGSNFLCGVDFTSNTAKTLHDSDREVVQLELRCEYINLCHPRVGRVVLRNSCFERALSVALLCRIPPPY